MPFEYRKPKWWTKSAVFSKYRLRNLKMDRLDLPQRIITATKRGKLDTVHTVVCMSAADIQRATQLSLTDIAILHQVASAAIPRPPVQTALELYHSSNGSYLSTGCPILDKALRGGIACQGITEITGESASGKTQLCLQLCLSVQLPRDCGGLGKGALYICTEDVFPSRRLQQLIPVFLKRQNIKRAEHLKPGDNIYIEHVAEVEDLRNIIFHRLPLLLHNGQVKLIIIDSVAALFRVEYNANETGKRAKTLMSFGAQLHKLSHQYNAAVICVNQVSDVISSNNASSLLGCKGVIPALGLAWSSMVTVRLMLSRTEQFIDVTSIKESSHNHLVKRNLNVIFAPHLSNITWPFVVDTDGVHGLPEDTIQHNRGSQEKQNLLG